MNGLSTIMYVGPKGLEMNCPDGPVRVNGLTMRSYENSVWSAMWAETHGLDEQREKYVLRRTLFTNDKGETKFNFFNRYK